MLDHTLEREAIYSRSLKNTVEAEKVYRESLELNTVSGEIPSFNGENARQLKSKSNMKVKTSVTNTKLN